MKPDQTPDRTVAQALRRPTSRRRLLVLPPAAAAAVFLTPLAAHAETGSAECLADIWTTP